MLTKKEITDNVTSNFKHVRKQLGLTQVEMAGKLELTRQVLASIEEGRASAPVSVFKLSRFINVSMDTIYTSDLSKPR